MRLKIVNIGAFLALFLCICLFSPTLARDGGDRQGSLRSWRDGATKEVIVDFIETVCDRDNPAFVPEEERIAVFDNDGTLWCEKPVYPQFVFCRDQLREAAAKNPGLEEDSLVKAALDGDFKTLAGSGAKGILHLIGLSRPEGDLGAYEEDVDRWIRVTKHPRFKRLYTECAYKPMLELLEYLKNKGFKTYIVSGGGRDFMRAFAQRVYGIAPEKVVGSSSHLEYREKDGVPAIVKKSDIAFLNDGAGKPVGIQSVIGRRPILAFGNSDGDFEMLKWTASGKHKHLCLLVHHTDAEREYAYDRDSAVGKLDRALSEAGARGFVVVDMKRDWLEVFADDAGGDAGEQ
ncbi:MAG: HAD family hydrolase [Candidatus Obscuribacterales bacterium]